ncbi:hypothetical protein OH807_31135 [Kitasatospora sp. NBC_01560]|uniref:NHL domain-containing protein n=1 Tax=Kitasatospora sp. NBC_01560 TaxID=2975965 RepID=UPI00386861DA
MNAYRYTAVAVHAKSGDVYFTDQPDASTHAGQIRVAVAVPGGPTPVEPGRVAAPGHIGRIDTFPNSVVAGNGSAVPPVENALIQDAGLPYPGGLAIDADHNTYLGTATADAHCRLMKIQAPSGRVHLMTSGTSEAPPRDGAPAKDARIGWVNGVVVSPADGSVYFTEGTDFVRRITPDGVLHTLVSGADEVPAGVRKEKVFNPNGIALDAAGNVYFANQGESVICRITPSGEFSVVAGTSGSRGHGGDGGPATKAQLSHPAGVAVDAAGTTLFIADTGNARIRCVTPDGNIHTIAGTGTYGHLGEGGPATAAQLQNPTALALSPSGILYITDGDRLLAIPDAAAIPAGPAPADLSVSFTRLPGPIARGTAFDLKAQVHSHGPGAAQASYVRLRLELPEGVVTADTGARTAEHTWPAGSCLPSGGTWDALFKLRATGTATPGPHRAKLTAVYPGETVPANNQTVVDLQIAPPKVAALVPLPDVDQQKAAPRTVFARSLGVEAQDASGSPLGPVTVRFEITGATGSQFAGGTTTALAVTDHATGRAHAPALTAGPTPGTVTVTVTAATDAAVKPVTYTAQVTAAEPAKPAYTGPVTLSPTSADLQNQQAKPGADFDSPLQVLVTDNGAPKEGVLIRFAVQGTTGSHFPARQVHADVPSDRDGNATAPALTAGTQTGKFTVKVTALHNQSTPSPFTAEVL